FQSKRSPQWPVAWSARSAPNRVQQSCEVIAEAVVGASKGQLAPGNRLRLDFGRFEAFLVGRERASHGRGGVDDDDRRAAGVGINVDEPVEPNREAALLARLANRRDRERLATVDVAAGANPFAVAWIDGSPDEHEAIEVGLDNRADCELRVDVGVEAGPAADDAFGLGGFGEASTERAG